MFELDNSWFKEGLLRFNATNCSHHCLLRPGCAYYGHSTGHDNVYVCMYLRNPESLTELAEFLKNNLRYPSGTSHV